MKLRVVQMRYEAQSVVSLHLEQPEGLPLAEWTPGSHVDVVLKSGLIRQYSLCGDPRERTTYSIAVLRDAGGRGGSQEIHDIVRVGDMLDISGPRNHFKLVAAERYVFIAGGIGITPILPMVEEVARRGAEWSLFYLGRTRSGMGFQKRLSKYGDSVTILPDDMAHGVSLQQIIGGAHGAEVYCCGPAGLIDAVESACRAAGLLEHCHVERFSPVSPNLDQAEDARFTAVVASTGQEIQVPPGKSLLHCLIDGGMDMLFSCEEGICGSCEVNVLEGVPLHRDSVLSDAQRRAGDRMMVCVSRALTPRIVLDL